MLLQGKRQGWPTSGLTVRWPSSLFALWLGRNHSSSFKRRKMPSLIPKWATLAWLCQAQTHNGLVIRQDMEGSWEWLPLADQPGGSLSTVTLYQIEPAECLKSVLQWWQWKCLFGWVVISFHFLNMPTGPRKVTNLHEGKALSEFLSGKLINHFWLLIQSLKIWCHDAVESSHSSLEFCRK